MPFEWRFSGGQMVAWHNMLAGDSLAGVFPSYNPNSLLFFMDLCIMFVKQSHCIWYKAANSLTYMYMYS